MPFVLAFAASDFSAAQPNNVDLSLAISESVDPVPAGSGPGNLTYTVVLQNLGPLTATNVTVDVSLTLPSGVSLDSATASGSTTFNGTVWSAPSIPQGGAETLTLVITCGSGASGGTDVIGIASAITGADQNRIKRGDDTDTEATSVSDTVPPNAISIAPSTTGPTNTPSIAFAVGFSENVVNFNNASDVIISHSGTAHSVVAIAGGPSSYTVTVSGITGDGSFTLAVKTAAQGSDIQDSVGLGVSSSVLSTPVQFDDVAPVLSLGPPSLALTNDDSVTYTATYSGADNVALTFGDVTLITTGSANATLGVMGTGNNARTIVLDSVSGDGTLSIAVGAGTASDDAGNLSNGAGPSASLVVDNTAPLVTVDAVSTTDRTPPLSGSIDDASASVEVTVAGGTYLAVNDGSGNWTVANDTISVLPIGTYDVAVESTDSAGNIGTDATLNELSVRAVSLPVANTLRSILVLSSILAILGGWASLRYVRVQ